MNSKRNLSSNIKLYCLTSLDISDVDTVWTWGTNVPPQKTEKTREFEKKIVTEYGRNSLNTLPPRIFSP